MGPVVNQLENSYSGRVRFQRFVLDKLDPASDEYAEFRRLAVLADFKVTPTFLIVDAEGKAFSRYEGATPYLSLRRDLEAVLQPAP